MKNDKQLERELVRMTSMNEREREKKACECRAAFRNSVQTRSQAGMKDENVGKFPFLKCDVITSLNKAEQKPENRTHIHSVILLRLSVLRFYFVGRTRNAKHSFSSAQLPSIF